MGGPDHDLVPDSSKAKQVKSLVLVEEEEEEDDEDLHLKPEDKESELITLTDKTYEHSLL